MLAGTIRLRLLPCFIPALVGLVASCGDREPPVVGCAVQTADGVTLVAPDASLAARHRAVSNQVAYQNETTLLPAAMCAEVKPEERSESCQQQLSAEQRTQCTLASADEATCAWSDRTSFTFSRDPAQHAILEDLCQCLGLDAEWCDAAIRDGEERAALRIVRRRDRVGYMATSEPVNENETVGSGI